MNHRVLFPPDMAILRNSCWVVFFWRWKNPANVLRSFAEWQSLSILLVLLWAWFIELAVCRSSLCFDGCGSGCGALLKWTSTSSFGDGTDSSPSCILVLSKRVAETVRMWTQYFKNCFQTEVSFHLLLWVGYVAFFSAFLIRIRGRDLC